MVKADRAKARFFLTLSDAANGTWKKSMNQSPTHENKLAY
jgi:hypothetical protein